MKLFIQTGRSTHFPLLRLIVSTCLFNDICLPPSSVLASPKDASKASSNWSIRCGPPLSLIPAESDDDFGATYGSIFHKRMVESCAPEARIRGSCRVVETCDDGGGRNEREQTQSSWPERIAERTNYGMLLRDHVMRTKSNMPRTCSSERV